MNMALLFALAVGQTTPGAILIDRGRVDRARPVQPSSKPATPRAPTLVTSRYPGTPIRGIRFVGAKAPAAVAKAARPFIGRAATQTGLAELAAALSTAYGDSPVALYTVAIPDQDFAGGVVDVLLTEGRIATAQVKTDRPGSHPLLRSRMVPLTQEAPLSRTRFERQVTLMRAIPGLSFDTALTDPGNDGALTMVVTPKQKRRKLTAGFSNRGVDLLGDGQFDLGAEFYGLARDGDQVTLAASAASDLKRYRYLSGGYALPLPADLTLSAGAAYLETRPKGFPITGRAKQANLSLAYPLLRSFHRSADLSLGVDALNSDNAAFGNLIASERTRAVRAAASYADARPKRQAALSIALSQGLDVAGARTTTADRGFAKATASASVAQAIGSRVVARASASGQYSRSALPAAERFAIGGEAIGRAFDTALLTGDRGAGGLGEIALRPIGKGKLSASELYGFVDGGTVSIEATALYARQRYTLASAGVGVRARYGDKAELGLEAARAIDDPYVGYDENWRISVAWRLSM